jgi:hypothetical protein
VSHMPSLRTILVASFLPSLVIRKSQRTLANRTCVSCDPMGLKEGLDGEGGGGVRKSVNGKKLVF